MSERESDRTSNGQFSKGNRLNRTHCVYGFLALGRMPKGCRSIRADLNGLRRALDAEARQRRNIPDGPLPVKLAAALQSTLVHEGTRRLWWRWLAIKGDDLPADAYVRAMTEAREAAESRDRAMAELLDERQPTGFADLLRGVNGH